MLDIDLNSPVNIVKTNAIIYSCTTLSSAKVCFVNYYHSA
jgi:hypothetical protein